MIERKKTEQPNLTFFIRDLLQEQSDLSFTEAQGRVGTVWKRRPNPMAMKMAYVRAKRLVKNHHPGAVAETPIPSNGQSLVTIADLTIVLDMVRRLGKETVRKLLEIV